MNTLAQIQSWPQADSSSFLLDGIYTCLHFGLFIVILYVFVVYIGIAFVWRLLLNSSFGEEIKHMNSSLDIIGSVFIFVYFYIWLTEYMVGYSDKPKKLRQLLNKIKQIGLLINKALENKQIKNEREVISEYTTALLICVHKLFVPYSKPSFTFRHHQTLNSLIYNETSHSKEIHKKKLNVILDLTSDFIEYTHKISKAFDINVSLIDSIFKELLESLCNADIAMNVRSPLIFKKHLIFSLYLYFFVWIPISIGSTVSDTYFLLIYPLIMFILTGPYIYRKWLGDPFRPNPPIVYNDYLFWLEEYVDFINKY